MTDHKPCDQDALIDVIAGAVDPANFGMRPEYYGNVAGAVEMAAAVNDIARDKACAALAAIATAGYEIMPPGKPCDPAYPCSTAFDLASERNTLDGLLSETKDRLDAALAQVARLREALADLLSAYEQPDRQICCNARDCGCRGFTVRDQAEYCARAALAETADTPAPAPADDGWTKWVGGARPVAKEIYVEVKYRDGETGRPYFAYSYKWKHKGNRFDIVAYRIVGTRDE